MKDLMQSTSMIAIAKTAPDVAPTERPIFYGDGKHDDADAMRSLFRGGEAISHKTGEVFSVMRDGVIHISDLAPYAMGGMIKSMTPVDLPDGVTLMGRRP